MLHRLLHHALPLLSGQAVAGTDVLGELTEDVVSELTDAGKRAYISSGTDKDYDITKPLAWLLED